MTAELERLNAGVAANGHHYEMRHSTFLGGEACLFAGGMVISSKEPGKIETIDNCSGHYRPSIQEFIAAIRLMNVTGTLNLNEIYLNVGLYSFSPSGWNFNGYPICTAKTAIEDFPEFERNLNVAKKMMLIQGIEQGAKLGRDQLSDAMAFGVDLDLSQYLDAMGMSEVQTKESARDRVSNTNIRTDINFF
jgi:hypothetical protein